MKYHKPLCFPDIHRPCHNRNEHTVYPYSQKGAAHQLEIITHSFWDYNPLAIKCHVSASGIHRLYYFDSLRFAMHPNSRKLITEGAERLIGLTQFNQGYKRRHKSDVTQSEFWPVISEFESFAVFADVKTINGSTVVVTDSTLLLAFESMLAKAKHDSLGYQIYCANNERSGKKQEVLPAPKPQLYFIDNKTNVTYCFSDADREAFFGNRPTMRILDLVHHGQRLKIIEAPASRGRVVLISMKLETKSEYRDSSTDLSLSSIGRAQKLMEGAGTPLVGVAVYINLSGHISFRGMEINSLVCRPRGSYPEHKCPRCHPHLR